MRVTRSICLAIQIVLSLCAFNAWSASGAAAFKNIERASSAVSGASRDLLKLESSLEPLTVDSDIASFTQSMLSKIDDYITFISLLHTIAGNANCNPRLATATKTSLKNYIAVALELSRLTEDGISRSLGRAKNPGLVSELTRVRDILRKEVTPALSSF